MKIISFFNIQYQIITVITVFLLTLLIIFYIYSSLLILNVILRNKFYFLK